MPADAHRSRTARRREPVAARRRDAPSGRADPARAPAAALRAARQRAGLSQHLLGLLTGTTQQNVSRWEQGLGVPDRVARQTLAAVLDLPACTWEDRRPAGADPERVHAAGAGATGR